MRIFAFSLQHLSIAWGFLTASCLIYAADLRELERFASCFGSMPRSSTQRVLEELRQGFDSFLRA